MPRYGVPSRVAPIAGRPEDTDRKAGMLRSGMSWSAIRAAMGCSRAAIAKSTPGPAYQAPPVTALGSPFSFVDLCHSHLNWAI